jgi:hypothetical protein
VEIRPAGISGPSDFRRIGALTPSDESRFIRRSVEESPAGVRLRVTQTMTTTVRANTRVLRDDYVAEESATGTLRYDGGRERP